MSNLISAISPSRLLLITSLLLTTPIMAQSPLREHGQRLYSGQLPLTAHIAGHSQPIAPALARCAGCHNARTSALEQDRAPRLTPAHLMSALSRRGGPHSAYDRASFCAVLRTGVDPAFVVVRKAMPRFTVTDVECEALWRYITTEVGSEHEAAK